MMVKNFHRISLKLEKIINNNILAIQAKIVPFAVDWGVKFMRKSLINFHLQIDNNEFSIIRRRVF